MLRVKLFLLAIFTFNFFSPSATGQAIFANGFDERCDIDDDNDRLSNCVEAALGTSTTDPDTDSDGLRDGDEVLGTLDGLDLPDFGVNPRRKDILIEHDWVDDATDCAPHTHRPSLVSLEQVLQIFASAPVQNSNGLAGINVIHDVGQGGLFTGGNVIAIPNGTLQGEIFGPDFPIYKMANMAGNRVGYFHYAIHAHRHSMYPSSSGNAEVFGDDFMVTLQCFVSDKNVRNTVMHELGHNLGLQHGGDSSCNDKPNYNSVMNYRFQFSGVDVNCDRNGDDVANYSNGTRITLNESALDESLGVCGTQPVDWNTNNVIENAIQADINPGESLSCGGQFTILSDFNDWENVILSTLPGSPGAGAPVGSISCQNTPEL